MVLILGAKGEEGQGKADGKNRTECWSLGGCVDEVINMDE